MIATITEPPTKARFGPFTSGVCRMFGDPSAGFRFAGRCGWNGQCSPTGLPLLILVFFISGQVGWLNQHVNDGSGDHHGDNNECGDGC